MNIHETEDGKFVVATFIRSRKCFRTCITENFTPSEAVSVNDLKDVRKYKNKESAKRAARKFRDKV